MMVEDYELQPLWERDRDRLMALAAVPEIGREGYALALYQAGYEASEAERAARIAEIERTVGAQYVRGWNDGEADAEKWRQRVAELEAEVQRLRDAINADLRYTELIEQEDHGPTGPGVDTLLRILIRRVQATAEIAGLDVDEALAGCGAGGDDA